MLSKVCAVWIVVLIILPFTAPLSSVTLEELMPRRGDRGGLAASFSLPAAEAPHAAVSHAASIPVPESRFLTRLHTPGVVLSAPLQEPTRRAVPPVFGTSSMSCPAVLRI
jgi:hypothetical protein